MQHKARVKLGNAELLNELTMRMSHGVRAGTMRSPRQGVSSRQTVTVTVIEEYYNTRTTILEEEGWGEEDGERREEELRRVFDVGLAKSKKRKDRLEKLLL